MRLKKKFSIRATSVLAMGQAITALSPASAQAYQVICGSPDVIQVDLTRFILRGLHAPNPELTPASPSAPTYSREYHQWRESQEIKGLPVECTECKHPGQPYSGVLPVSAIPWPEGSFFVLHPNYDRTVGCRSKEDGCPDLGLLITRFKEGSWRVTYTPAWDSGSPSTAVPAVDLECIEK